jgi:hypothetical protein
MNCVNQQPLQLPHQRWTMQVGCAAALRRPLSPGTWKQHVAERPVRTPASRPTLSALDLQAARSLALLGDRERDV